MIGRPRGKQGKRPVYVYDSSKPSGKRYVGSAVSDEDCKRLELEGKLAVLNAPPTVASPRAVWTVDSFADYFLDACHGPNTTRPEPATLRHNEQCLREFRAEHGRKPLAKVDRALALEWATYKPHQAQSLAAMFAEAFDREYIPTHPFARLGVRRGQGRANIDPLTEDEIATLADIARARLGLYGPEFAAYITVAGWAGLRPGEMCALDWVNVDLRNGEIRVDPKIGNRRKDGTLGPPKAKKGRRVILAPEALRALRSLPRRPGAVFCSPTSKPLRVGGLRYFWVPVRTAFTDGLPADHWLPRRLMADPDDQLDVYELRHAFGSMLADRGLSEFDISQQMGNTPRVCGERYIHAHRDRVRDRVKAALGRNVTALKGIEGAKEDVA